MQHGWNDNEKVYSSGRKHIFNIQGTHCTLDNRVYLRAGFIGAVTEGMPFDHLGTPLTSVEYDASTH